jgi:hypothetical protein
VAGFSEFARFSEPARFVIPSGVFEARNPLLTFPR